MMTLTTDPAHSDLHRHHDTEPTDQAKAYLVLDDKELAKGYIRPYNEEYVHLECGKSTRMDGVIAQTYATDPWFYGGAYCYHCRMHRPHAEFVWKGFYTTNRTTVSLDPDKWETETSAGVMAAITQRALAREKAGKPPITTAPSKYWKAVEPPPKPAPIFPTSVVLINNRAIFRYPDGTEKAIDAPSV